MKEMVWPRDAAAKTYAQIKQIMTDTGDEKTIGKISKDELKNGLFIDGVELDPVEGGATQATAKVIAPGPAGQKRKMEASPGWYSVNGQTVEAVTGKRWIWGWSGTAWALYKMGDLPKAADPVSVPGPSTESPASQKLATDIQNSIFSDAKPIALGALVAGRYASSTNAIPDTNASYLKTGLIDVLPEWDIYKNNEQSGSSNSWQFDKYGQPLAVIKWTATKIGGVEWFKASKHPKVAKIALSGSPTNMNAATLIAANGISANLKKSLGTNKFPDIPTGQNQFTAQGLIYPFYVPTDSTDGALVASNNFYITPIIPLLKTKGRLMIQNIPSNSNSSGIAFYKEDGVTLIKNVHIKNTDLQLNGLNNGFYASVDIPATGMDNLPAVPAYYRYWFDQRLYGSSMETISKISITYSGDESAVLLNTTFKDLGLTAVDVKKIMQALRKVKKDISDLVVLVLGDSNTENSGGRGSWNNMFQRLHRPRLVRVRAVAGATVTSTENLFGQQYAANGTANTLLRQCEIEIKEYLANPNTFEKPDLIIITGGTNDFDLARYVTPATISTYADYTECMEALFVTDQATGFNVKKDLTTIDRSKVGGALRYIHERFMQYFPEAVQFVATPLRSTLHNQVHAKRFVNEMLWMAERWQLPVIDVFNKGGITTIKDFGADRFNLTDRVHVFNAEGQSRAAFIYGMYIVDEVYKLYVPNSIEKLIS